MKEFEIVCGNQKLTKLVQINGTTGLAKDIKPRGALHGIVQGFDSESGVLTYYLVMDTMDGLGIYATQVKREVDKIKDLWVDADKNEDGNPVTPIIISCTEGISRKSGKKFFKIMVESC